MSHGKCWYSESPDPQSGFDVDHFRPKNRARRAEKELDPGYQWLAFSVDNFRFSAQRSNRRSANEDEGDVEGKGDWFPLLNGSPKACWEDRCENTEQPVLLDPLVLADVQLLAFEQDGTVKPNNTCVGVNAYRVEKSCELYGLNLPRLTSARSRVIREVSVIADAFNALKAEEIMATADGAQNVAAPLFQQLREKAESQSPYSRTAKAEIIRQGLHELLEGVT